MVQGRGDHTKQCGYFLAQKGVRSINVNCYVILTGPQQGRSGVIIIIYRESTWAQYGPFQGHWPGPGLGLEPRLSASTAGFPPTALPQKDRQNLSRQMLAIGRKFQAEEVHEYQDPGDGRVGWASAHGYDHV